MNFRTTDSLGRFVSGLGSNSSQSRNCLPQTKFYETKMKSLITLITQLSTIFPLPQTQNLLNLNLPAPLHPNFTAFQFEPNRSGS